MAQGNILKRFGLRSCLCIYRLHNEDFEFPDLLGIAYEFLISEFVGKKGGEFYIKWHLQNYGLNAI